jgi:DNA-directed RNA polymerase specialized sigma24 family protein
MLTDDILTKARAMNPAALGALLSSGYASAHRIALALSGDERIAGAVANLLVKRSLVILPRWRDPSSPENWFTHHAVHTTRAAKVPPPADPLLDPLVVHSGAADNPGYVAFIRALRQLHAQQREAFILHHGERLNERMLGVAMDCSTAAARVHLQVANDALDAVSDHHGREFEAVLARAYAAMGAAVPPPDSFVRVQVRRVRRRIWWRRMKQTLFTLLVLAGVGYAGWLARYDLWELLARLRQRIGV